MASHDEFVFRPAAAEEMPRFTRIMSYVFAEPPSDDQPPPPIIPEWTQCAFSGDDLAAISGAYPFIVRLNGKAAPIHGVTAVGTEPQYRRRGLVRRLITDLLHRGKEEGQVGSILLASMGAIYQRFGYGLGSAAVSYRFDPRLAVFQEPMLVEGGVRRLQQDEALPMVKSVFREYISSRNMMAHRGDVVWERFFTDVDKDKAYCAVHMDATGKPDGYCLYTTKWYDRDDGGPNQELTVRDYAYSSLNGFRGVWEYLCSHDLVGRIVMEAPEDDPAPGLLLEPRSLNRKTWDGMWFRVIDAEALLAARGYDVDGQLTIKVANDDLCDWNNGTYRLTAEGGDASVQRVDDDAPDLVCSVSGLATLVSGYSSASYLNQIGRITVNKPEKIGVANALFATRHRPALSFGF